MFFVHLMKRTLVFLQDKSVTLNLPTQHKTIGVSHKIYPSILDGCFAFPIIFQ